MGFILIVISFYLALIVFARVTGRMEDAERERQHLKWLEAIQMAEEQVAVLIAEEKRLEIAEATRVYRILQDKLKKRWVVRYIPYI